MQIGFTNDRVNRLFDEVAASSARNNISLLIRMRWLAMAGQVLAISVVHFGFGVTLPLTKMAIVIAFQVIINISSFLRTRVLKRASDLTITIELLFDMMALTIMLFLSGGASNPFVSMLMLQVVLGLILLPTRFALILLFTAIGAHYWLLSNGLPLLLPNSGYQHMHEMTMEDEGQGPFSFDLHLQGMFLSFTIAACLLFWFVTHIVNNLKARDSRIVELQRQMVEEDHVVRLGLIASGAAHELGTPLTTVAVTLDDWLHGGIPERRLLQDQLFVMLGEIRRCRDIVSDMLLSSGQERMVEAEFRDAATFLREVSLEWQAETASSPQIDIDSTDTRDIVADPMLEQAIRQLLENAAEAGARNIRLSLALQSAGRLGISLADDGPGFPADVLATPGHPYLSHREGTGRGLGLFLASNVIRRIGGEMHLRNDDRRGAVVSLVLPALEVQVL